MARNDATPDRPAEHARDARSGAIVGENLAFGQALDQAVEAGLDGIRERATTYRANMMDSRLGFVADADHAATFNARAALDRSANRATLEPNGHHGDLRVADGHGRVVARAEVKSHRTAEHTEHYARGYGDQQRVVPKEQLDEVKRIARRKAIGDLMSDKPARQAVGREHAEVAEHATDRVSDGQRASTPRTRDELRETVKKTDEGRLSSDDVLPPPAETAGRAALSGAKAGAVLGGGISAVVAGACNAWEVHKGRKEAGEALADTAVAAAVGAVDGAVKGALGSAVRAGATQLAGRVGSGALKSVLRSGGPAAVAVGAVEVVKDLGLFAGGKIDGGELGGRCARTAATTGAGWAGAEVGAALGTIVFPGVGTVIGGIAGGLAASLGVGALFK